MIRAALRSFARALRENQPGTDRIYWEATRRVSRLYFDQAELLGQLGLMPAP